MKTISFDVSIEDYHRDERLSASKLKTYEQLGARGFYSQHIARSTLPAADKHALVFGQVFEDVIQGRGFNANGKIAIKPEDMKFNSNATKKWRDDHLAAGRSIVTQDDVDTIMAMRGALEENETAVEMVRASVQQATLRADYAGSPGLESRPDYLSAEGCLSSGYAPFSLDLKSTKSLGDIARGGRPLIKLRYDAQGAICRYAWGVPGSRHFLLACEKVLPFRCQVIELTPAWLDQGWQWTERQLSKLARHYETGVWPRVEREMIALPEPPSWGADDMIDDEAEDEAA